jgi:hypothetical protein
MYNVFTDFHHAGLLNSLIMLFEGRLSGNVYRPIGMDWAEKGYWKIYDHPATQAQYLGIGSATPDGSPRLNEVVETGDSDHPITGVYHCKDIEGDRTNKAITFDAFMAIPMDILVASIPAHIEPFKRLCREHPNHPKLIYQIGNSWTIEAGLAPNIMASAKINDVPPNVHFISYHQEFDTKVFARELLEPGKNIYSFVNCFNTAEHLKTDWELFTRLEQRMPEWSFKAFGGQCRDGCCNGTQELANTMRKARFIWHTKNGGDGYGHVLHNSAAVGRPLITHKIYYSGKLGEQLMIDGKTCINIDNLSLDEMMQKIEFYNIPERYVTMCNAVYENFKQVCNFDADFLLLRDWLTKLV